MSTTFTAGRFQAFDSNGNPLSGGKLYTYAAGTSTPQATYTTSALSTPNANPVILDSAGRANVWLAASAYRMLLKTSADVTVTDDDGINQSVNDSSLTTYTPGGTGAVTTTVQTALRREVWVDDFGASPAASAATNSAAFTAAILYVGSNGGGTVRVGRGQYDLSATVLMSYANTRLMGEASSGDGIDVTGATILRATHSAGPVVRVSNNGCTVSGMVLTSNTSRYSGAAGSNYGLQCEGVDAVNAGTTVYGVRRTMVYDIRVTNQPNHGVLMVGDMVSSTLEFVSVDQVKGHGFAINGGKLTSRTNVARPGQVNLDNCRASRCGGHTLLIGDGLETVVNTEKLDRPYRVLVNNFESFYGYQIPASAPLGAFEAYIYGENHEFMGCAFSGNSAAATDDHTSIYVAGQNITFRTCRFVDGNPYAASVVDRVALGGPPLMYTGEVAFEHCYINHSTRTAFYNPAILVAATCKSVSVTSSTANNDIVSLMSIGSTNFSLDENGLRRYNGAYVASGFCSVAASITLADDQAGYWQFPAAGDISIAAVSGNVSAAGGAFLHFRVGDANAFCWPSSFTGGTGTATSVGLLSTGVGDGTDGLLNFSASTVNNRLYMKNRTGASRAYEVTFLNSRETVATFVTV